IDSRGSITSGGQMTLNAIAALCADVTFQAQIRGAAVGYAHTVLNETASTHGALQGGRWALAQGTLTDGCVALLQRFVWGIATTPGFTAIVNDTTDTNDAAINSAMISQWNTIALLTTTQQNN